MVCNHLNVDGRKDDKSKLKWSLLPWDALEEMARVQTWAIDKEVRGNKAYEKESWRAVEDFENRYKDALIRHMVARYTKGEVKDKESEIYHSAHMAVCALFLLWRDIENAK